jgi:hypothetical protein
MQRFLVLALLAALGTGRADAQSLRDNFDTGELDKTRWVVKQVRDDQVTFPAASRCGTGIEITVREGDRGKQCDTDCQRAEVRTIPSSWPTFGDEVWYRFSFKVSGDIAAIGSSRFVIGQWKGPGDGSPMLAQRFDNGVFHITVQDNDVRYVIASAEGDPDAVGPAPQELAGRESADPKAINAIRALRSRDALGKARPSPVQPLFLKEHSLKSSLRSEEERSMQDFPDFARLTSRDKHPGGADIEVTPEPNAMLPDPRKAWVDMVYRIRPGRTDNEYGPRRPGEIDVWANGKKIVSVRGNIGATLKKADPLPLRGPYFKFGIYRLRQPGVVRFSFDEFSQGSDEEMLTGLCKPDQVTADAHPER